MHVMLNILVGVQMIAALSMIGLVLVQHGKGADMGASFGSGSSGSLFGASGSANFLSRMTAICAGVFFVCTLGLAYFSNYRGGAESSSVLDRPAIAASGPAAASAPVAPPVGAAQIPGNTAAPNPAPAANEITQVPGASAPAASGALSAASSVAPAPAASDAAAVPAK